MYTFNYSNKFRSMNSNLLCHWRAPLLVLDLKKYQIGYGNLLDRRGKIQIKHIFT